MVAYISRHRMLDSIHSLHRCSSMLDDYTAMLIFFLPKGRPKDSTPCPIGHACSDFLGGAEAAKWPPSNTSSHAWTPADVEGSKGGIFENKMLMEYKNQVSKL
jgi:hypothetical protein